MSEERALNKLKIIKHSFYSLSALMILVAEKDLSHALLDEEIKDSKKKSKFKLINDFSQDYINIINHKVHVQ